MKLISPALLFCICLAAQSLAHGEAIKLPPGLNAGDQYRLAFVTTAQTTAQSDDIETYNAFVQATADAAPIGDWNLEWKAIGSTATVSARQNTSTDPVNDESVPIFLLDGTQLVPDYASLWHVETDEIFVAFDVNEFGEGFNLPDNPLLTVWTGTGTDGFAFELSDDVAPITGGPLGEGTHSITGFGDSSSISWINSTIGQNDLETHMYGLSSVLTVVPEPAGYPNITITAFIIFAASRRRIKESSREVT